MPIAWHPTLMQDSCMTEDGNQRIKEMLTQGGPKAYNKNVQF